VQIVAASEPVTLVTLSPLTDVAVLLGEFPETQAHIREIIVMGGGIRGIGNVTPCAEFNIYSDPVAAERVFHSGIPIMLVPLDATTSARLTLEDVEDLQSGSILNEALVRMLRYYSQFHAACEGFRGCYLHDVLAVALAIDRSLAVEIRQVPVRVDTRRGLTFGQTVADLRERTKLNDSNIHVVLAVDACRFVEHLISVMNQPSLEALKGQFWKRQAPG
jgi:inosine-uridine nucleoside N-ribohydrolase